MRFGRWSAAKPRNAGLGAQNEPGPARDIVALNAGAAIYAADLAETLSDGVERAAQVIASGLARQRLDALAAMTQSF